MKCIGALLLPGRELCPDRKNRGFLEGEGLGEVTEHLFLGSSFSSSSSSSSSFSANKRIGGARPLPHAHVRPHACYPGPPKTLNIRANLR